MSKKLIKFRALKNLTILNLLCFIFCTSNCQAAEITILNDLIKDKEGIKLEVDNITIKDLPKSKFRVTIYPGEEKLLASGSITHFTLSRVFNTHKIKYDVTCIEGDIKSILTLSQIHENKMNGVCTLKKFGHWSKRSGLKWNDI